jgi:hypothetical protein
MVICGPLIPFMAIVPGPDFNGSDHHIAVLLPSLIASGIGLMVCGLPRPVRFCGIAVRIFIAFMGPSPPA